MTFFTRLTFKDLNEEVAEAALSQYGDRFKSFDFDSESAASYQFEEGRLVERHTGLMTLYKENEDSRQFKMTRENIYQLNRNQLQKMESSYEVLRQEGLSNQIGLQVKLLDSNMDDLKTKFETDLLDLKKEVKPEFLFSFDYGVYIEMAQYMNEKEWEVDKGNVEQRVSVNSHEREISQ